MRFHWQNLNEKKYGKGNPMKTGRAWLYFWGRCLAVEWGCRWGTLGFGFGVNDHHDKPAWGFSLHLLMPYLYVSLIPAKWRQQRSSETGIRLCFRKGEPATIHAHFRYDDTAWDEKDRGWHRVWFIRDIIRGRQRCDKRNMGSFPVEIPLPEGAYQGTATVEECVWSWSRWPFKERRIQTWVNLDAGLPKPGKGENSWDCGDDAIMGYGCDSTDYADIVATGVQVCMRDRVKYGSRDWRPKEVARKVMPQFDEADHANPERTEP